MFATAASIAITGTHEGFEVVQICMSKPVTELGRRPKELKAFKWRPAEAQRFQIIIDLKYVTACSEENEAP